MVTEMKEKQQAKFCPDCGVEVPPTRFGCACDKCAPTSDNLERSLKYDCEVCKHLVSSHDKFCRFCGLELWL